jgi:hypothetical protein
MVVVANQQNRGPGLVDTGTLNLATVLGSAPQPGTIYVGAALMQAADRDDPTLVLGQVSLYIDGAVVWGPTDMTCGGRDRNGNPVAPSFAWGYSGAGATTCRITLTLPRVVRLGLDVSTTPMTR